MPFEQPRDEGAMLKTALVVGCSARLQHKYVIADYSIHNLYKWNVEVESVRFLYLLISVPSNPLPYGNRRSKVGFICTRRALLHLLV